MKIHARMWINLKNMPNKRSQTQKVTLCMIPSIRNVQNRQMYRDRKQISDGQGLRMEEQGVTAHWFRVSFWADEMF